MDESDKINETIIPLGDEAMEWLKRALQWPEDLAAYDKLNTPINGSEFGLSI
jgi:hypothetical protein